MRKKKVLEEEILFYDVDFFGDKEEHEYDCVCQDGIATGKRFDDEDINAPESITIKYPLLSELSNKQKDEILEYRGLYDLSYKDIHYGDVMVVFGTIVKE